ncbi:MAG: fibronectin type III domain-containing protein, partial [Bacteroidales bacterium]|nr:fibronectin type III domain-containing protein [Bacteroidales bacterium]
KNKNKKILDAYKKGVDIDTDTIITGIYKDDEGKAIAIIHEAFNNSNYLWKTSMKNIALVDGLRKQRRKSVYAQAFKGVNGFDYLAVTNRSGVYHKFSVLMGNDTLNKRFYRTYMSSDTAQKKDIEVVQDTVLGEYLVVPPYSVVLVKWESGSKLVPQPSRIYKSKITNNGIDLTWWKSEIADGYKVDYGGLGEKASEILVNDKDSNNITVSNLQRGKSHYFVVYAINDVGISAPSDTIFIKYQKPQLTKIDRITTRDTTLTVYWKSQPGVSGYNVTIQSENGKEKVYDAQNVFGYRVPGLQYGVKYNVFVTAYNGLGKGEPSDWKEVVCIRNRPLPPRDVSATQTIKNHNYIHWIHQDTVSANVQYRIFRGSQLHQFDLLVEGIDTNYYIDSTVSGDENFYYTVKSYTTQGECNYYPNIATVIKRDEKVNIEITSIEKMDTSYLVTVQFENILLDGLYRFGIAVSDITYLNLEEKKFVTQEYDGNTFKVNIPISEVENGKRYSLKAYVATNNSPIYSLPPHKIFEVKK